MLAVDEPVPVCEAEEVAWARASAILVWKPCACTGATEPITVSRGWTMHLQCRLVSSLVVAVTYFCCGDCVRIVVGCLSHRPASSNHTLGADAYWSLCSLQSCDRQKTYDAMASATACSTQPCQLRISVKLCLDDRLIRSGSKSYDEGSVTHGCSGLRFSCCISSA